MQDLSESELLFYGGLAIMAAAVFLAVICIVSLSITGHKIRKKLEQEYGKQR